MGNYKIGHVCLSVCVYLFVCLSVREHAIGPRVFKIGDHSQSTCTYDPLWKPIGNDPNPVKV